jgi:hypothetical protein
MSIIKLPIHYEGSKGGKTLSTLFDNQIVYSCINASDAYKIAELTPLKNHKTIQFTHELIESNYVVLLDFYINNLRFSDEFMVIPNLEETVIIGATTLRKWRIQLDFENNTISAKEVRLRI